MKTESIILALLCLVTGAVAREPFPMGSGPLGFLQPGIATAKTIRERLGLATVLLEQKQIAAWSAATAWR